jgi:hypothetical protein
VRESKVEKDGKAWAESQGWLVIKYRGERGYPDRIFIKGGTTVWIEIKKPGEEPSEMQYFRMKMLKNAGAKVSWASSVQGIKTILGMHNPTPRGTTHV